MAINYESRGPQVALTGPKTQGGFQAGQAYDASSMMLQQSERDLQAFAGFSRTLNEFIQQKGKERNKIMSSENSLTSLHSFFSFRYRQRLWPNISPWEWVSHN